MPLAVPLLPLLLAAQPAGVVPLAAVAPDAVRLSETVRLTLTLEGPTPLRVELPDRPELLLDESTRRQWKIDRPGDPAVSPLDGGRERWSRTYRLSPFVPGDPLKVGFESIPVRAGGAAAAQAVTFPELDVRVLKTITEVKPEAARPVTGIEELPAVPPPPPEPVGWKLVAGLGAVFVLGIGVGLVRKWRAKPPALPPALRAWAAFDRAAAEQPGPAVERAAAALREYVARRFGVPAPQLTTSEVAVAPWPAGFPADAALELSDLLARADLAKFAAAPLTPADAADLIAAARAWVTGAEARATP
jgi:hypothetical protein